MSHIEKLQIQGIRSFGPRDDDKSRIDFIANGESSPLTLILGQNGCGKTTIIECLRYITTGDYPPGSYSGRSFVHDPKMARESRVIGHVKLQFKGLDGRLYIIARTIEGNSTAKSISIKTLDGVITRKGINGEKNSTISGKCTDINAQMAIHLGISKPILNYVIFCHQEDSNWPLDEGSKVKDKFDEIFASAKYKECLKRIKDVRSKHMEQQRIESSELKYLAGDKDLVNEKRSEKARKENAKEILQKDLSELEEKMKPIEDELREIRKVKENFVDIEKEISSAEKSLEHCQQESSHLEKTLDFIIEDKTSDGEVHKMKDELEKECNDKQSEIIDIQTKLESIEKDIVSQDFELKKVLALIGQYRESQLNYLKNKKKFGIQCKSSEGEEFDLPSIEDEEDPGEREKVLKHLQERIKNQSSKFASDIRGMESEIEGKATEISEIEIKKAQLEEQKKQKQLSLMKAKKESATLRKKLNDLEGSSDEINSISRRLESKCQEYEKESNSVDLTELAAKIKANKSMRSELNTKETQLKEERKALESQRQLLSEIEIKEGYLAEKTKQEDRILAKRKNDMKDVFNTIPKPSALKNAFNEVYESLSERSKSSLHDESKYKSDISNLKDSRIKITADIEAKEKRVKDFKKKMSEFSILEGEETSFEVNDSYDGVDPFEKELETTKTEVEKTRFEVQIKEANIFTFKEFIERLKETDSPCCPTCNRSFHKKEEIKELISDLETEIKRIPNKVRSIKTKLKKAESKRDNLIDLLPEKRQCDELKEDITKKKAELTRIEKKIKESEVKLTEIEDTRDVISMELNTCNDLRDDIQLIDRLDLDKRKLQEDILDIKSNLGAEALQHRDYKTVKDEEDAVSEELNKIRNVIETDQTTEMRQQKLLNDISQEKNYLTEQKLKLEAQQQERTNIEARRNDFENLITEHQKELGELSASKIEPLEDAISKLLEEKNNLVKEKAKEQDSISKKLDKIKNFTDQLQYLNKIVVEYEESDNETKFQKYIASQEKISKAKELNESKRKSFEKSIHDIESYIANQSSRKRTIDDNLRLRKYRVDEAKHRLVVDRYKQKMKSLNLDSYKEKESKLLKERDSFEASSNVKRGRLEELKRTLADINRELNSPKFKNAEKLYREKNLMFQCRQHVVSDLNKYYVALDWAIMKFHQERMQVINKIIRELWRSTYKGNDIDYIEIKTDDTETSTKGADKRKIYNYRVVMIKNDTELEMRGRCSAGQKVLASLIIRLALAETFSANCGIIALDEPTTNLDRENICSLADALARIVRERSARSNFQLIVITHDEDLIDQLGRVEKVDKYYKVSRNENGLSEIRKFNIHNLQPQDDDSN